MGNASQKKPFDADVESLYLASRRGADAFHAAAAYFSAIQELPLITEIATLKSKLAEADKRLKDVGAFADEIVEAKLTRIATIASDARDELESINPDGALLNPVDPTEQPKDSWQEAMNLLGKVLKECGDE